MLMIRFQRIGRRNDPAFRIAVLEKTAGPKAGKYVDLVGTYNPKTKAVTLKPELIREWMSKGAQVSPSLHNLLVKEGALEGGKSAAVVSKKNLEKNKPAEAAHAEAAADDVAASGEGEATDASPDATAEGSTAEAAPEAPAADETPAAGEVVVAVPDEMEAEVEAEAEPAATDEETAEETVSHAPAADQTGEEKAA